MTTISAQPRLRHWGSFATADLPNVAGSANTSRDLLVGETAYNTSLGKLVVCTNATLGSAIYALASMPAGTTQDVIWEWNGVDVSQFGDGTGTPVAGDVANGPATGTLAVTAVGSLPATVDMYQPLLKYTHTGGTAYVYFPINDLPSPMPDNYTIYFRLGPRGAGTLGTGTSPALLCWYQDPTHFMLVHRGGAPTSVTVFTGNGNNGVTVGSFGTVVLTWGNVEEGTFGKAHVETKDPTGATDPRGAITVEDVVDGNRYRFSSAGVWTAIGGGIAPSTTWHAGWKTGGTVKRPGIMFQELGAAGSGYIAGIQIRKFFT